MLLPRSRKLLSSLTERKITRSSLVTTAGLRPDVRLGERNPLKAAESCDDHALASRVMTKCAISAALTDAALGTLIPRRAARGHLASIVDRIRDAIRSDEPTGLRPRNQTRSDGVLAPWMSFPEPGSIPSPLAPNQDPQAGSPDHPHWS